MAGAGFGAGVSRFVADADEAAPDEADAYGATTPRYKATPYYKASLASAPTPRRWNVWAAAFGGSTNTNGDPNGVGSANFTARTGAVAAGVDYKLTQDTLIGVALAGGGTSWGLAQGLGSGHSDAFQAGLYASQRFGAWYLPEDRHQRLDTDRLDGGRYALGDQRRHAALKADYNLDAPTIVGFPSTGHHSVLGLFYARRTVTLNAGGGTIGTTAKAACSPARSAASAAGPRPAWRSRDRR